MIGVICKILTQRVIHRLQKNFLMATHNPKFHTIDSDGTIIFGSKHLDEVVEVHINKVKRRFYGIKKDGTVIESTVNSKE